MTETVSLASTRAITRCSGCQDLLWFDNNDPAPQSVICGCTGTLLTEDGPEGSWVTPTTDDPDVIP